MVTTREAIGVLLLLVSIYGSGVVFGVILAGRSHARASKAYRMVIYTSGAVFVVGMIAGLKVITA